MNNKDDGGQAFPLPGSEHGYPVAGMSLRDYFAAKAMQGRCALAGAYDTEHEAVVSYRLSDAMLAERAK